MANTYFQFKKFIVHQDKTAMKVCTDSCVFGAMLPTQLLNGENINTVLDVGTGTGLLSLMYAQRNANCQIETIEIEPNSFEQASGNVTQSKFAHQIKLHQGDFFSFAFEKKYDLIFSNPPFYQNDLRSANIEKNLAHHSTHFDFTNFMLTTYNMATANGLLALLLPSEKEKQTVEAIAKTDWKIATVIHFHQNEKMKPFRQIYVLSVKDNAYQSPPLIIKEKKDYTFEFKNLLKDFYLQI